MKLRLLAVDLANLISSGGYAMMLLLLESCEIEGTKLPTVMLEMILIDIYLAA